MPSELEEKKLEDNDQPEWGTARVNSRKINSELTVRLSTIEAQHEMKIVETNNTSGNDNYKGNIFSKYNYNREVYANTEGYAVIEPGSKGAYMIRSVTQSIVNNDIFGKNLDDILLHTRKVMLQLMGMSPECGAQVVEDHNNIPNQVFFK